MPAIIFVRVSADCFHLHILARTSPQEVMNSQPTALTALKCFSFEVRVLKTVIYFRKMWQFRLRK